MKKAKGVKMWTPDRITSLRTKFDLTQRELAELLDYSMFTVRNWEQGQDIPGRRACRALDLLEKDLREGRVKQPA
jgi:DNA-binding transcriptional regulator YiaG